MLYEVITGVDRRQAALTPSTDQIDIGTSEVKSTCER